MCVCYIRARAYIMMLPYSTHFNELSLKLYWWRGSSGCLSHQGEGTATISTSNDLTYRDRLAMFVVDLAVNKAMVILKFSHNHIAFKLSFPIIQSSTSTFHSLP